jgi:signal transduction histidine kinase
MVASVRPWEWYVRRTALADAGIAAVLLVVVLFVPSPGGGGNLLTQSVSTIVFSVVACVAVAGRNRWPLVSLAVSTGAVAVVTAFTTTHDTAVLVVMLGLYTLALRTDRRFAYASWAVVAGALLVATGFAPHDNSMVLDVLSLLAWTALAAAIGDGVRTRRAYVAAVEERALRAEDALQEEARRQVAEERLRIARELHDVVAHHMAVVTVQAGVASHLLSSNPAAAAESLGHIKRAGRTVLEELSAIMSVLRDPDEAVPAVPSPGLDQIDELMVSFKAAGLDVALTRQGQPQDVGAAVDLVAFRVLQEALTNAHKHGTGSAHAAISYSATSLLLCVTNPMRGTFAGKPGHGLIGMRERAAAVGGQIAIASDRHGQFSVDAVLPLALSHT